MLATTVTGSASSDLHRRATLRRGRSNPRGEGVPVSRRSPKHVRLRLGEARLWPYRLAFAAFAAFIGVMSLIEIDFHRSGPAPAPILLAVWRALTMWGGIVVFFFPIPYYLFRKGFYGDRIALYRDGVRRADPPYGQTVPVVSDVREDALLLRWMNLADGSRENGVWCELARDLRSSGLASTDGALDDDVVPRRAPRRYTLEMLGDVTRPSLRSLVGLDGPLREAASEGGRRAEVALSLDEARALLADRTSSVAELVAAAVVACELGDERDRGRVEEIASSCVTAASYVLLAAAKGALLDVVPGRRVPGRLRPLLRRQAILLQLVPPRLLLACHRSHVRPEWLPIDVSRCADRSLRRRWREFDVQRVLDGFASVIVVCWAAGVVLWPTLVALIVVAEAFAGRDHSSGRPVLSLLFAGWWLRAMWKGLRGSLWQFFAPKPITPFATA